LVSDCIPKNSYSEKWEIELLEKEIFRIYGIKIDLKNRIEKEEWSEKEILEFIQNSTDAIFAEKEKTCGTEFLRKIEKQISLITIDSEWKDHLLSLDKLRQSINLRAYAQKDPLIEYKQDSFGLFEEMVLRIEEQVLSRLAHVQFTIENNSEEINLFAHAPKQQIIESILKDEEAGLTESK
jgi:preprotein translocase subunit SecA